MPSRASQELGLNPGRKRYVTSPVGAMPTQLKER